MLAISISISIISIIPIPIPNSILWGKITLHQPQGLLNNQQIPLNQLRPVLHIPDLLEPLARRVRDFLPLIVLLREARGGLAQLVLLLGEGGGVVVEVSGAVAQVNLEVGA